MLLGHLKVLFIQINKLLFKFLFNQKSLNIWINIKNLVQLINSK